MAKVPTHTCFLPQHGSKIQQNHRSLATTFRSFFTDMSRRLCTFSILLHCHCCQQALTFLSPPLMTCQLMFCQEVTHVKGMSFMETSGRLPTSWRQQRAEQVRCRIALWHGRSPQSVHLQQRFAALEAPQNGHFSQAKCAKNNGARTATMLGMTMTCHKSIKNILSESEPCCHWHAGLRAM